MKDRTVELLDCDLSTLKEFYLQDLFNDNMLEGVICRQADHRYGSLVIFRINDEKTEQIIWSTPKLHYPVDRDDNFHWPQRIFDVEAYEKLDGTNILAFHYTYKGKDFVTYKTRLTPIISDMSFGSFCSMWEEMLQEHPWIETAISDNPEFNLSFELYGSRNPITIKYDVPLSVSLLFGVNRKDHCIVPPTSLDVKSSLIPLCFKKMEFKDMTGLYMKMKEKATQRNTDDTYLEEGFVFYLNTGSSSWEMFKCKADQIEKIHRLASSGISEHAIWTTALNTFEHVDAPEIQDVIELLKEEFSDEHIARSSVRIEKLYNRAKEHMELTKRVNEIWKKAKEIGMDITKDKAETFRFMSKYFDKKLMRRVGSIVLKQAGL
ncbi:MAG: hypothetical protein ACTSRU_15885 [Candidatus Hodarchaeales archaeon]